MKTTRIIWDMPVVIDIIDRNVTGSDMDEIYRYFEYIDSIFSPFRPDSEITGINSGFISENNYSRDMKEVLAKCRETKSATNGYFEINNGKILDPLGLVKGWAVKNAGLILEKKGFENFYIDAGGDLEVRGKNHEGKDWLVGVRNPFDRGENIKVLKVSGKGVATSGTYIRGDHIYNPYLYHAVSDIVSLTVIGPDAYEADRFATAAFAMGREGIYFIDSLPGFEGILIDKNGRSVLTRKFNLYESD